MKQKKISISAELFKNLMSTDTLRIMQILDKHSFSLEELKERTALPLDQLKLQLMKLKQGNIIKEKQYRQKSPQYRLTFKGSNLLHPENPRVIILFCASILTITATIGTTLQRFIRSIETPQDPIQILQETNPGANDRIGMLTTETAQQLPSPFFSSAIMLGLILCIVLVSITLWRYKKNKAQAL
jgi:hypothetical protein